MMWSRRDWFRASIAGTLGLSLSSSAASRPTARSDALRIRALKITPIALPDPPILAASGCHGPYFLRNIVELETDSGIVGIGETKGGEAVRIALEQARDVVVGRNCFAYRSFSDRLITMNTAAYTGIELACLDAWGKATGRRLCELLGGPVREQVEFAAYLFYRFAADHSKLLADPRLVDDRGRGDRSLDDWGEVRTPEAMAEMADRFRKRWGFRVLKLKGGVLPPDVELESLRAMHARFGDQAPLRIDPNARWKPATATRIGAQLQKLPIEYYEDPVAGQTAMAEVRRATGLKMATNMCVTRFQHIPDALEIKPVDIVLADHHYWGGLVGCLALGQICQSVGWQIGQHSNNHAGVTMAAMIHLGAVVPHLTYASDTHYPWLVAGSDVIEGDNLSIRGGMMSVPSGDGVGVSLDRDKLGRAHEVYQKCGMSERDDATTMRLIEPGWTRELL